MAIGKFFTEVDCRLGGALFVSRYKSHVLLYASTREIARGLSPGALFPSLRVLVYRVDDIHLYKVKNPHD